VHKDSNKSILTSERIRSNLTRERNHEHGVLTETFTAAKTSAKRGSFDYLVRLGYSLDFIDYKPPVVLVVPYVSPNGSENADSLAASLVEPVGTCCWDDLNRSTTSSTRRCSKPEP